MTHEDVVELRRELGALDALLEKLAPEDDLARLAMDPKRQAAAATLVGTVMLARDLLLKARTRLSDGSVPRLSKNGNGNGKAGRYTRVGSPATPRARASKNWGSIGPWLLEQITKNPVPKADVIALAKKEGFGYAAVYGAMTKLQKAGQLKSRELDDSNRQEVWKVG